MKWVENQYPNSLKVRIVFGLVIVSGSFIQLSLSLYLHRHTHRDTYTHISGGSSITINGVQEVKGGEST